MIRKKRNIFIPHFASQGVQPSSSNLIQSRLTKSLLAEGLTQATSNIMFSAPNSLGDCHFYLRTISTQRYLTACCQSSPQMHVTKLKLQFQVLKGKDLVVAEGRRAHYSPMCSGLSLDPHPPSLADPRLSVTPLMTLRGSWLKVTSYL